LQVYGEFTAEYASEVFRTRSSAVVVIADCTGGELSNRFRLQVFAYEVYERLRLVYAIRFSAPA